VAVKGAVRPHRLLKLAEGSKMLDTGGVDWGEFIALIE
jgi:hypothetical protein